MTVTGRLALNYHIRFWQVAPERGAINQLFDAFVSIAIEGKRGPAILGSYLDARIAPSFGRMDAEGALHLAMIRGNQGEGVRVSQPVDSHSFGSVVDTKVKLTLYRNTHGTKYPAGACDRL